MAALGAIVAIAAVAPACHHAINAGEDAMQTNRGTSLRALFIVQARAAVRSGVGAMTTPAAADGRWRGLVLRHPTASFFTLAYALAWADWVPMALAGRHVGID